MSLNKRYVFCENGRFVPQTALLAIPAKVGFLLGRQVFNLIGTVRADKKVFGKKCHGTICTLIALSSLPKKRNTCDNELIDSIFVYIRSYIHAVCYKLSSAQICIGSISQPRRSAPELRPRLPRARWYLSLMMQRFSISFCCSAVIFSSSSASIAA